MKKSSAGRFIPIVLFLLLILARCSNDKPEIQDVSPVDAAKLIQSNGNNPGFMILDVRTAEEYASGHLAGAKNIDYQSDDFDTKISQLDKNRNYLVYCRSGHRSSGAVKLMKDKGFTSLSNLKGGLNAWMEANQNVVTN